MVNEFGAPPLLKNVKLKNYTTLRIGGKAERLYVALDTAALCGFLKTCGNGLVTVLGRGSNVLVSSRGVKGLTVIMRTSAIEFDENGVSCIADAGVPLPLLSRIFHSKSLSGLEWAAQIPGSLGGGVKMNCGAFGHDIASRVEWAEVFRGKDVVRLSAAECGFGYRQSGFYDGDIILRAKISGFPLKAEEIAEKMNLYRDFRKKNQPAGYSAGSIFKGAEKPAGWYIDRAGLKGLESGRAYISLKHANFIINSGFASSDDVLMLMNVVKAEILLKFGIELVPEVRMIGDFNGFSW